MLNLANIEKQNMLEKINTADSNITNLIKKYYLKTEPDYYVETIDTVLKLEVLVKKYNIISKDIGNSYVSEDDYQTSFSLLSHELFNLTEKNYSAELVAFLKSLLGNITNNFSENNYEVIFDFSSINSFLSSINNLNNFSNLENKKIIEFMDEMDLKKKKKYNIAKRFEPYEIYGLSYIFGEFNKFFESYIIPYFENHDNSYQNNLLIEYITTKVNSKLIRKLKELLN